MADVDDRGQLMLVGALTLAVMLVALAVLLNAAIYTGNVATRDAGPGTAEVIEYEDEATSMARQVIQSMDDSDYPTLRGNFTDAVDGWSEATSAHSSVGLADASLEPVGDPDPGTEIRQSTSRNVTSASEAANWTVANDTAVRAFRMNLSQDSLATPNNVFTDLLTDESPGYYYAEFDDGSSVYRVQVRGTDDGDAIVRVLNGADNQVGSDCETTEDRVLVDVTGATVGGDACPALGTVFDNLGDTYTLSYRNSENAKGTYSMVVDSRIGKLSTGADTTGSAEPSATRTLYGADLRVTYRSADVYYRSEFRVAPGEPDA